MAIEPTVAVAAGEVPSADAQLGTGQVHVVATPGIDTTQMVAALAQTFSASGGPKVSACDPRDLAVLATQSAAARIIACVGHPARQVMRAVLDGNDVAELLDRWRTGAQEMLRAVQVAPHRFLCLDLDEVESSPPSLPGRLGTWLQCDGLAVIPQFGRTPVAEEGWLARFLAQELVRTDKATTLLYDELLACCAVLADEPSAPRACTVQEAVAEYRDLLGSRSVAGREQAANPGPELSAARQENDLLLLQLHQVQEELESYYLQLKEAEAAVQTGLGSSPLHVERVHEVLRHDAGPHRHLELRLEGLVAAGGSWSTLHLRLVEHVGRPGLVLFADAAGRKPLSAWHASGREGEREFMLMVPGDAQGARLFQPMGSADWHFVTAAVARAHQHLQKQARHDLWPTVAARLCRQLADLPPRLRYDALEAAALDSGSPVIEVRLLECTFDALQMDQMVLHWDPQQGSLNWQAPADVRQVPLSGWPVAADGRLVPWLTLPVASSRSARDKRAFWCGLGAADRALALALLDALPAVAARAPEGSLPANVSREELARQAAAWHKEVRRLLVQLQWLGVVRRLVRRAP